MQQLSFSGDGTFLAASCEFALFVWHTPSQTLVKRLEAQGAAVDFSRIRNVPALPQPLLASSSLSGTVQFLTLTLTLILTLTLTLTLILTLTLTLILTLILTLTLGLTRCSPPTI